MQFPRSPTRGWGRIERILRSTLQLTLGNPRFFKDRIALRFAHVRPYQEYVRIFQSTIDSASDFGFLPFLML
jgi:hypothetical protein